MAELVYFEDVNIGDIDRVGPLTISREDIIAFAREYDPQPFHLSDEAAAETHFGKLAASGWQVTALFMKMMVARLQQSPGVQETSIGAIGIDELRWLKPVHAGDTLQGMSEVIEKRASRSRPEMGIIKSRVTLFNQKDQPVMSMVPITMRRTRPA